MKNHKSVSLFLLFLSISNLYSIASLSEELKGFNKLFLKLKKINVIEENVVSKFDEIKLIGITNIKNTLIVLQINGNSFEIIPEKEKHGYKLLKVEGTSAHLLKDNQKYIVSLGDEYKQIPVTNTVFTSNLSPKNSIKTISSHQEAINKEFKNFINEAQDEASKINFTNFEKKIVNEITKVAGRTSAGRLGFKVPQMIIGQSVKQFGLKKDDVIMTINNIPVGKINDIYNIYKDEDLKQFDLEILRKEKLILVEWYR